MKKAISTKAFVPNGSVSTKRRTTKDSFQNFEARIGYGTGNVSDGAQYNVNYLTRNRQQLDSMYRSSWICGKAVDSVAEDMTKRGIEINSVLPPDDIDALMSLWKRLKLWDSLADTIKWSRLYGGAIAVVLIDGQDFATPLLVDRVQKDQFKGLLVLDRWMVQPTLSNLVKELGPDLGLPMFYELTGASVGQASLGNQKIHYSRVLRFAGQDLPYFQRVTENLWGQSVIERLFDRLLAFDSTTQGAAQLVYKAHLRTYKIENLREIIALGGPAYEGLIKNIDFIRSTQTNEGMTLMDAKDVFEAHSYSFGGLDTVLLQFSQQLSGALDIPLTRLFGQAPAGLNATGEADTRNYYDGINMQQERRLRVGINTLLQVTHQSQFGKPIPQGTDFNFRPLWQLTDEQKAAVGGAVATAVSQVFTSGLVGRQTSLKELRQASHVSGMFTNITDEAIEAADDDVEPGDMGGEESGFKESLDQNDDELPKAA